MKGGRVTNLMNPICKNCDFDVSTYPATVEVADAAHTVYCPVCGQGFEPLMGVPEKDVFYDSDERGFFKWTAGGGQPEAVERLEVSRQFQLAIRARPLDYQQLFYSHVLVFVLDGEISQNQLFAPPESRERYGLRVTDRQLDQNEAFLHLRFELKGGSRQFRISLPATVTHAATQSPSGQVANGSALTVWPNFKREGWRELRGLAGDDGRAGGETAEVEHGPWRDYFVQFATDDPAVGVQTLRFVGERPGEEKTLAGPRMKGALDFAPKYVEVKADVTRPGQAPRQYQNCFEVNLHSYPPQTSAPSHTLRVAIDFGTSNTCVCYVVPGERGDASDNTHTPKVLKLRSKNHEVVRGLQFGTSPEQLWVSDLEGQEFVPSELIFRDEPRKVLNQQQPPQPILDYTIPASRWRKGEEGRICAGFKWKHATEPGNVRERYEDLQRMYLGLLLRMVVAELVTGNGPLAETEVHPNRIELIYTFPLAMPKERQQALGRVLESVGRLIHERTGVEMLVKVGIDESRAGEGGIKMQGEGQRIFIDIGGGTTDIAVIEQLNNVQNRQLLLVDSTRYAGNDFLAALTQEAGGGHISTRPLIELQRRVRFLRRSALEDISIFGGSEARKEEAQATLESFLLGVSQYLARLIVLRLNSREQEDGAPPKKLRLYLLGNGWNFVLFLPRNRLANPNASAQEVMHEEVRERLYKELEKFRQGSFLRHSPPARWDEVVELNFPPDPKTAVARGALEVTKRGYDDLAKSFVGSDVEVVTAKGQESLRWDTPLPKKLGVEIERVSILNPITGFEELRVPDYQYEHATYSKLSDIDIKRYVSDDLDGLVRSAFNVYLERWHKKFLTGKWVINHQSEQ